MTSQPSVAVCVAGFHTGNPGEYILNALRRRGCQTVLLDCEGFYDAVAKSTYDFFFCVDSGEPFDFRRLPEGSSCSQVAMWFIDYRHNKERPERRPNDLTNVRALSERGGTIFQAQLEDQLDVSALGIGRCFWLPMAADPYVWGDEPRKEQKKFQVGFIGNVWDQSRKAVLEHLLQSGMQLGFPGHGGAWKEDAAAILRNSLIGFNVSSFYGTPYAFDLNMRFFETLSVGIPLVTNWVPSLEVLIPNLLPCIKVYRNPNEILPLIRDALSDPNFLTSGRLGREWLLQNATYDIRIEDVFRVMGL